MKKFIRALTVVTVVLGIWTTSSPVKATEEDSVITEYSSFSEMLNAESKKAGDITTMWWDKEAEPVEELRDVVHPKVSGSFQIYVCLRDKEHSVEDTEIILELPEPDMVGRQQTLRTTSMQNKSRHTDQLKFQADWDFSFELVDWIDAKIYDVNGDQIGDVSCDKIIDGNRLVINSDCLENKIHGDIKNAAVIELSSEISRCNYVAWEMAAVVTHKKKEAELQITYANTGTEVDNNVTVYLWHDRSFPIEIIPDSVILTDTANPNGKLLKNEIAEGEESQPHFRSLLGNYASGEKAIISFRVKLREDIDIGKNPQNDILIAECNMDDNGEISDATIIEISRNRIAVAVSGSGMESKINIWELGRTVLLFILFILSLISLIFNIRNR